MRARLVVPPLLVLLTAGFLAVRHASRGRTAPPPPPPPTGGAEEAAKGGRPEDEPHKVVNVRTETIPRTESFPARVHTPERVEVFCPVLLTPVEDVLVTPGQAVNAGETLFRMSAAPWERELARARGAGDAKAVAEAEKALSSLEARAPVDGVVFQVDAIRGERPILHRSGPRPLVVLYDWRKLSFEGTAPRAVAELLARKAPVFVRIGKEIPVPAGEVRTGEPGEDGSLPVEVWLGGPPTAAPGPEDPAEILVATGLKEVPVIPVRAVRFEGGRPVVYVVDVLEKLHPRTVVLGTLLPGGRIEVSGLDRFDSVAVWESDAPDDR